MPRTRLLFIVSAILISANLQAQVTEHTVPWGDPMKSIEGQGAPRQPEVTTGSYLWFNMATYPIANTMLPYYSKRIAMPSWVESISQVNVSVEGASYAPLSNEEQRKVREYLSIIDDQKNLFHVSKERGKSYLIINVPAVRINPTTGAAEKLLNFRINTQPLEHVVHKKTTHRYAHQSVLRSGLWVKVRVNETGIHRVSYSELEKMGLSNIGNVSVWGHDGRQLPFSNSKENLDDLKQIPVWVDTGNNSTFNTGDHIYFYAQGPITWAYSEEDSMFVQSFHDYSESTHYFITTDQSNPVRIQNQPVINLPSTRTSNAYDALVYFERNDTNLIRSGRQWFGESFDMQPNRTYLTGLTNPVTNGHAKVKVLTAVRSASPSSFSVRVNNQALGSVLHSGINVGYQYGDFVSLSSPIFEFRHTDNDLNIELTFNSPSPAAMAWLDYITVNARQELTMGARQLMFRDNESVAPSSITEFRVGNANSSLNIWDVTDFFSPQRIPFSLNNGAATFKSNTNNLKEFIAFNPTNAYNVDEVGIVPNQNIHGEAQPEMVIVTHPDFLAQAQELATIHRSTTNLNCQVVTTEQVYNEFSSGTPDASAIRNMMRMFYNRSGGDESQMPRYLLLFGDGSYDNRSNRRGNTNFIPTYQSENSIHGTRSYVTDDFFGILSPSEEPSSDPVTRGLLDLGVGRIPSRTPQEATTVVNKIRRYKQSVGSWHNQLCFIADDGDGNEHMRQSDIIANKITADYPTYNINKIYLDAYPRTTTAEGHQFPDATIAINNQVNQGALIVNYIGHANARWLAHEKILLTSDIRSWRNYDQLNLFITATCEFSRFDDFGLQSAGEISLFAPRGGSVGLISTTRVVFSGANFVLNQHLFNTIFEERENNSTSDQFYRLGDAVRIAKNNTGSVINKLSFSLLGDPALMLHYPTFDLDITEINSTPIDQPLDTIRALSHVEVKGRAPSISKSSEGGEVSIALFDKEVDISTMGHDEGSPFNYTTRQNVIYRGRSSMNNGEFTASFIVPKDIMYRYGNGRISLFGEHNQKTGAGYFEDFIVGGISDSVGTDNQGPDIEIYLNDRKFVPGGTTDPHPKLIVYLSDSSGINTTGAGIGHDLSATLINEDQTTYVLNDYYEAELDSYQKGKVEYQLANLPPGPQTIRVKAWDVYNNSSEAEVDFNVTASNKLTLSHVLNYPNPFTQNTAFYFEQNQPYEDLDIIIQIFSPSGKLVKTIEHYHPSGSNYRIGPIAWDGLDDFGDRIGRGVYFYKLRVRASNGMNAEEYQKLVILK